MSRPAAPAEAERLRKDRYAAFYAWRENADKTFRALGEKLAPVTEVYFFNAFYTLVVVPAAGEHDKDPDQGMVRVFYGTRSHTDPHQPKALTMLGESGASLTYQLLMDGSVLVMLAPAAVDREKPIEEGLVLGIRLGPKALTAKALEGDWRHFHRYMRVTSLDGAPTFDDQWRVAWLRLVCRRVVAKRVQTRRILSGLAKLGQWSATVGLSGLLLWGIQSCTTKDKVTPALDQLTKAIGNLAATEKTSAEHSHQDQSALLSAVVGIKRELTAQEPPVPPSPRPSTGGPGHRDQSKPKPTKSLQSQRFPAGKSSTSRGRERHG
ncbi:MAG: hypothetical protein EPN74_01940 [Rhodanobacter sp.]|nr:MAG: hypothetical protein EPN74_01940 [Rhodanobacter sp.]